MRTLRTRLMLIFVAATALPLAATLWMASTLLERSLTYSSTAELDTLSKSLQTAGREYYNAARASLMNDAASGRVSPRNVAPAQFDAELEDFWSSHKSERFSLSRQDGPHLNLFVRGADGVAVYSKPLNLDLAQLSDQYRGARATILESRSRDLRRGFNTTLVLITLAIWAASLFVLVWVARRFSKPIRDLTTGLAQLAGGNFTARLQPVEDDEIGRATAAFNNTAAHLEQSRDRLVYLTQLASWQVLAKKTAHEIKNSLTPIRLTVEEMVARHSGSTAESQRVFLEQAAQIVVDEIESLERRIRAFSEFSAEPPVCPEPLDINSVVEERIAFLRRSHPEIEYAVRLAERTPTAMADQDLVKSILVNLLENAAEAAGDGGRVLARTESTDSQIVIEVHDSGPGLSELARKSLFQPTISFKKRGMGLGLSIARKCALLTGGDIVLVGGELGGAGFRVVLPILYQHNTHHESETRPDR
jgi:two-component system nitrogen regulation sensor histidine kinase NtrY